MHFLITNDDGFDAPGLAALYTALIPLGQVTVVAPAVCHSSRGHAVDTKNPIRIEKRNVNPFGGIHIVHASPADCIRVGLAHVLETPPDAVVAGINPGANLGVDLFYSGTAAAAREAALMGLPAIAVSRYVQAEIPIDWDCLATFTRRVVRTLSNRKLAPPRLSFWNVNFPSVPSGNYPEQLTILPHGVEPHAVSFRQTTDETGQTQLHYTGVYRERGQSGQCDVHAVFSNQLTASLVGPQMTIPHPELPVRTQMTGSAGESPAHHQVSLDDAAYPD
ncbi:MAG: 5'/3'-nucleotidase SurE [Planctomycetaceae bacterium]|nr:5'/3'-nucleotidase SurE [Planctomycetaceae bacterium]